jgi:putative transposase
MSLNFSNRHFKADVIMMAMRWYLSYSLSYREVEELLLERGVSVDHSTIQRWVERYAGELESAFRKRHKRCEPYTSWRMDETYVKLRGKWGYLYRAVDKHGNTLDFMFSETRTEKDAFRFLKKAIGSHGLPEKITIDKSGANEAAVVLLNCYLFSLGLWLHCWVECRQIKYLNNMIEQDRRHIKKRTKPMLGFKSEASLVSTIAGYELINMLRKGQFDNAQGMTVFEQFHALAA